MDPVDKTKNEEVVAFPIPAAERPKLSGWEFYNKVLKAPKHVVAPMVDQSELAWRLLSRRHGAQLCYTPMYHANIFIQDPKYRAAALQSCPEDRPLIIQFCGNDPKILLEASLLAQDHCDAVDINLGCPQAIAKRGHYGAFLQDEWDLLHDIVSTLHKHLAVPVTCKIRVFTDVNRTIAYARMLEKAGAQMLTVHGRTREQKGPLTGMADWSYIKTVREHIKIPMFANGNILSVEDIDRCLHETGVQGVMTAEGNLHNPAIFESKVAPLTWDMANEYLDLVEQYPCPASYIRGHLFKIFHHLLNLNRCAAYREAVAISQCVADFRTVVRQLQTEFSAYHTGTECFVVDRVPGPLDAHEPLPVTSNMSLPPWMCQPYIRMEPDEHRKLLAEKERAAEDPMRPKRVFHDDEGNVISRKMAKKLKRVIRRPGYEPGSLNRKRVMELCQGPDTMCLNPVGTKCEFSLCKQCCREQFKRKGLDCLGHRFLVVKHNQMTADTTMTMTTEERKSTESNDVPNC